jgi:hypothetical protein
MTEQLALLYIPKRAAELGFTDYLIRIRHLILKPDEQREINSTNQIYFLIEEAGEVRIDSDSGVFDLSETRANELTYEHTGSIVIKNYAPFVKQLRFIQLLPNTI